MVLREFIGCDNIYIIPEEVINVENNFDWLTEEEQEELKDAAFHAMCEVIMEEDSKAAIIAPQRMEQMRFVYAVAKFLTKNTDAKVSYTLHKPFKSMGSISIESDNLIFDGKWFSRAAEFANNTEIYPLTNGKIRVTFTFHGLTMRIE